MVNIPNKLLEPGWLNILQRRIMDTELVQPVEEFLQPEAEVRQIFPVFRCPAGFG